MVHALEEIRRLLKSTGVLIDMHPIAEFPIFEIHQGGKIVMTGNLLVRQWIDDYQHVDGALAEVVQRGLYVVELERVYEHLTAIDTNEEIRMIFNETSDESATESERTGEEVSQVAALTAQVENLMQVSENRVEMSMYEQIHISRMKPV